MKKRFYFGLLSITALLFISWTLPDNKQYPPDVEAVLIKAGSNRLELEKALQYFQKRGDEQMLRATYFLISNMDIHYSETYNLKDSIGNRIRFCEFDYPDITSAITALDSIRSVYGTLEFQDSIVYDINSISGQFLIDNINQSFDVWRSSKFKDIPFKDFCEYILPYRVTTEPIKDWRTIYRSKYQWMSDSLRSKSLERILEYAGMDYSLWFVSNYGGKPLIKEEPPMRLDPLQLLFRKTAGCENIAALQVFSLRSQGIPASYDIIPWWATSMGAHFVNSVFDENMDPIRFDVTFHIILNPRLAREPGKVLRTTYSKQADILASKVNWREIPPGMLRAFNYIDVTDEWWETSDITMKLFEHVSEEKTAYAYIYNLGKWRPVWWGEVKQDSVTFSNMPQGTVILPAYYKNGRFVPAGYPVVNGYNHQLLLAPDTLHRRTVKIKQQGGYLIFRPGKRYKLFYWDTSWKPLGTQIPEEGTEVLTFENVPDNALLQLIPEYSVGKERPFIILPDGKRHWW